jgi:hypothetical protein
MEPAVRGPGPQSGITPTRPRHLNLRWLENRNCGCERGPNSRPSPDAGNGIFGCGDRAPKAPTQTRHCAQRPKSGNWMAESPRRNALFSVLPEIWGLRGLGGGGSRAQTGDPPPSHRTGLRRRAGNGNLRCRDGHAKAGLSPSRDQSRDARECKKPPFRRNKCENVCGSLGPTTGWWRQSGTNWRPTTQSSNRSPPPSRKRKFCDAETGTQKPTYHLAETNPDARECKKPPFRRNKCEKACGSLSPTTGWRRRYGSNWLPPTQSYRTASLPPP